MPSDLVPVQKRLFSGTFASAIRFINGSALGMSGMLTRPSPSLRLALSFVACDERREPRALVPESWVEPVRCEPGGPLAASVGALAVPTGGSTTAAADCAGCMPQTSQKPSTMCPSQLGVTEHVSAMAYSFS